MDWQSVLILALVFTALGLTLMRTDPRRRRWFVVLVPMPTCFFVYRWAAFRDAWSELGTALLIALVLITLWWFVFGRNLPPPKESEIRVWSKDDPF